MDTTVSLGEVFTFTSVVIGFIIWLVRLEGKVLRNTEKLKDYGMEIEDLQEAHKLLDSKVMEQLSDVRQSLARIEGALGLHKQ